MDTTTTETTADRIARMWRATDPPTEARVACLTRAHEIGVDDATFRTLCESTRCPSQAPTIVLPQHKYEGMSRGKGWCRQGQGKSAVWGERERGGYRVGPGHWIVGGNDGFARKGQTEWTVEHVQVGTETWTVAE